MTYVHKCGTTHTYVSSVRYVYIVIIKDIFGLPNLKIRIMQKLDWRALSTSPPWVNEVSHEI